MQPLLLVYLYGIIVTNKHLIRGVNMDTVYWVWLATVMGEAARIRPLLERFDTALNIYNNRELICSEHLVANKQRERMLSVKLSDIQNIIKLHTENDYKIACYCDMEYPPQLKQITDPPAVLYYKGNIMACQNNLNIGVVGARNPSAYGVEVAKIICTSLVKAKCILISGLAAGLDSEAHRASVKMDVPTIAVLGTAIDKCFPAANFTLRGLIEKNGAVISEYPIGTNGNPAFFVQRNRIIAGICQGLCVIEAKLRSGTMSTVNFAIDYGRDVYAVPGSIFSPLSEGTNLLIQQGAKPICKAEDILVEYGITVENLSVTKKSVPATPVLTDIQKAIYDQLTMTPITLEKICEGANLSPAQVLSQLTILELDGVAKQLAGRKFVKMV